MTIPTIMPDPLSFIPPFSFDLVASETHETLSKPTEFPVELGANISDHIQVKPNKYTIIGVVSDMVRLDVGIPSPTLIDVPVFVPPLVSEFALINAAKNALFGTGGPAIVNVQTDPIPGSDPVLAMHTILLAIQQGKFLCGLTTTTQSYTDMCLTSVNMTRKDDEGKAEFTCIFEHITTVSSQTVAAPKPLIPAGAPKVSGGAQTPTPTEPDGPQDTAAKAVLDKAGIKLPPTAHL